MFFFSSRQPFVGERRMEGYLYSIIQKLRQSNIKRFHKIFFLFHFFFLMFFLIFFTFILFHIPIRNGLKTEARSNEKYDFCITESLCKGGMSYKVMWNESQTTDWGLTSEDSQRQIFIGNVSILLFQPRTKLTKGQRRYLQNTRYIRTWTNIAFLPLCSIRGYMYR